MKISVVNASAARGRKLRAPQHPFVVKTKPWSITPFFLAPVLPGESLKTLNYQAQVQTGYLKNRLSGWWFETWFFYVKHRDLQRFQVEASSGAVTTIGDLLVDMHVKNDTDAVLRAGTDADRQIYRSGTGDNTLPWVKWCTEAVVAEYFRNEGEVATDYTDADGRMMSAMNRDDVSDSILVDAGAVPDGTLDDSQLPGDEVVHDLYLAHGVPAGFEGHFDQWQRMKAMRLLDVDFESYLKAHGIAVPQEDDTPDRPELIRYIKDWTVPLNRGFDQTFDQVGYCRWQVAEQANKTRFFKEPGFLLGLMVARPKVFVRQEVLMAGHLSDAFAWLPHVMNDRPETSLRMLSSAEAAKVYPGYTGADGVWFDVKDLFVHGEQYVSGISWADLAKFVTTTDAPRGDMSRRYADAGDVDNLWFTTEVVGANYGPFHQSIVAEGIVKPSILSRVIDTTPGTNDYE